MKLVLNRGPSYFNCCNNDNNNKNNNNNNNNLKS